ncbi:MAG: hypothetical protein Q4G70_02355 [Pseudomonadota bacterium]|nr:hypothetical protein [Pseudomonadota bacterium]
MTPPPAESEAALRSLRRQYHFRPGPDDLRAWDVHRLIRLARDLPVIEVPLADIRELDENWWFQHGDARPTPRAIVDHVRLMDAADLRWPIILSVDGGVMDGMHRVAQALRLGHTHISAQRFVVDPAPDHVGRSPDSCPIEVFKNHDNAGYQPPSHSLVIAAKAAIHGASPRHGVDPRTPCGLRPSPQ